MRKRIVVNLMLTLGLLTAAWEQVWAADRLERYEFLQIEMGVPFRLVLYAGDEAAANKAARAAYARIKHLNSVMSDYDPDSELMRLCRSSAPGQPVQVSRDLERVISHSLRLSQRTDGAFDITIGPVVKLWRIARRRKSMPTEAALAAAREKVGYKHVRLDSKRHTIELLRKSMRLDLGGIAKGFAADEALEFLKGLGISRALIDGSGDIVVGDPPPGEAGWIIEIDAPQEKGETKAMPIRLQLSNAAVATSGDAYQFVEIAGKRYSHIINPQTGLGLSQSSSVTVIAENGMIADSLASAVSVLGPKRGLKLVGDCQGRAVMVTTLDVDGSSLSHQTATFAEYISADE